MKKYLSLITLTAVMTIGMFFMFSGFAYKADLKLGYINSEKIFSEYSKFKEAAQTLEQERTQLQQDLQAKQTQLESKGKEFESQSLLMSETRKEEAVKELQQLDLEIRQYTAQNFGTGGKLEQRWQEITQPLIDAVQTVIDEMGEEGEYDMIFDSKAGTVLYGNPDYDLTEELLLKLNELAK